MLGVTAVVADEAVLGLVAAVVGVAAAGVGALVDVRRTAPRTPCGRRGPRRDSCGASSTACRRPSPRSRPWRPPGTPAWPVYRPVTDTEDWEIDPVSGLLRERHLPVLLQQVVAAARRKVQPVVGRVLGARRARRCRASRDRPGAHRARRGGVAHAARERRGVPPRRRRRGRRCSSTPPSPARCMVAERVRERAAIEPGGRLAHRVGRDRVLPHRTRSTPPSSSSRAGRALELRARAKATTRDHVAIAEQPRSQRQRRRAPRSRARTSPRCRAA